MTDLKARNYCITFWKDPTPKLPAGVRYAIYGEEITPTTNRLHWQSYIELDKPTRPAAIKKLYADKGINISVRRGTREQARDYCKKEKKFTEHGEWISGQGCRTDLKKLVEDMKSGTKLSDIMLNEPNLYCRYRNGLKDIYSVIQKKNNNKYKPVEVIVITGPSRTGKTRLALEEATFKIQGIDLNWWQDYDGDEVIVIDEYANNQPIDDMLRLLDNYVTRLNVKGGHTYSNFKKIYITTNLKQREFHKKDKEIHREALFNRIDKVINKWPEEAREDAGWNLERWNV